MSTEAQIAANRRNAEASTGPRTAEGKARVSRNSTTFGLYSAGDVVRPEEESLYQAFCEDFQQQLGAARRDGNHSRRRNRSCRLASSPLRRGRIHSRSANRSRSDARPGHRRRLEFHRPRPNSGPPPLPARQCRTAPPSDRTPCPKRPRPKRQRPQTERHPGRAAQPDKTNPIRTASVGVHPPRRTLPLRFRSEIQTLLRHERPGCAFARGLT